MPKYLLEASYTAEGLKGVRKDGGSGRREAAGRAIASAGGKMEALYFAFGENDVIALFDAPDNITAAALALTVSSSGLIRTKVTPLLTAEEVDAAVKKQSDYRPPGR
jgi:uncharacterized protein with GYD domain